MPVPLAPTSVTGSAQTVNSFVLSWVAAFDPPQAAAAPIEVPRNVLARFDADRVLDVRFDAIADITASYEIYVDGMLTASVAAGQPTVAMIQLSDPRIGDTVAVSIMAVVDGEKSLGSDVSEATVPIAETIRSQDVVLNAAVASTEMLYPSVGEAIRVGVNWAGQQSVAPFNGSFTLTSGSAVLSLMEQDDWRTGVLVESYTQPFTIQAIANFPNGSRMVGQIEVNPQNG